MIKYHELRNDRALVLCPKRLRENWALFAANDRRNPLAADRFNYDVLHHTDLSRDRGTSGDLDLANLNWGNYDLVVIDESHNFRNKTSPERGRETRYDRLMRRIIKEGVKTRVLMLSATPVNNRLADLRNQIAFATEGDDAALAGEGVSSVDATCRRAQQAFNAWRERSPEDRTPADLVAMLGFDYFRLLDRLTIARSRRHVERYYGTEETGKFPDRRPPVNVKSDVDLTGGFEPIGEHAGAIQRLHLAAFTPIAYAPAGQAGRVRGEVRHRADGGPRRLETGGPGAGPRQPDAGQRPEAVGKQRGSLSPHRGSATRRRGASARPTGGAGGRRWRRRRVRLAFD